MGQNYRNCEIVVVDNASGDATADTVRAAYPSVEVVSTGENLGYAGGNNVGMRRAMRRGAEAVFLINNDTWLDPNCVAILVEAMSANPGIGVMGPMVYTADQRNVISSAGGQIDWRNADALNVGAGQLDEHQYPAREVDFVNGCGILVTARAISRVGLLDARYFMYWEETDWCLRLHQAGFGVWIEPAANMIHKASLQVEHLGPTTLYYVTRNRLRFFAIHTRPAQKPFVLSRALHGIFRGIIQHQRAGRPDHARATEIAVWHALTGRWGRFDVKQWLGGSAACLATPYKGAAGRG